MPQHGEKLIRQVRDIGPDASLTLAVIDDHPVVQAGIQLWATAAFGVTDAVRAYHSVAQFLSEHRRPTRHTTVIYDPEVGEQCPDFAGLEKLQALGYPVIAYSRIASAEVVLTCLESGAISYVVKSDAAQHLLDAIEAVQGGSEFRGSSAAAAERAAKRAGRPSLTPQERRVLAAWIRTDNKDAVARKLHISPSTVRTHLQRIRRRYELVGRPANS
jgi:DNA-binding NarL/FixJ family response regulator